MPGNGGAGRMGIFRTIDFSKKVGDRYYATHGETIVCAIEFAEKQTRPMRSELRQFQPATASTRKTNSRC